MQNRFTLALYTEKSIKITLVPLVIQLFIRRLMNLFRVSDFDFDKVKIYNLFADYPHNLTPEEKEIFDKENPYWCDFFKVK